MVSGRRWLVFIVVSTADETPKARRLGGTADLLGRIQLPFKNINCISILIRGGNFEAFIVHRRPLSDGHAIVVELPSAEVVLKVWTCEQTNFGSSSLPSRCLDKD